MPIDSCFVPFVRRLSTRASTVDGGSSDDEDDVGVPRVDGGLRGCWGRELHKLVIFEVFDELLVLLVYEAFQLMVSASRPSLLLSSVAIHRTSLVR